jgi:hypothetical protein
MKPSPGLSGKGVPAPGQGFFSDMVSGYEADMIMDGPP